MTKRQTLLSDATATGDWIGPISGGDYVWRTEAANWAGATATLQFLGLDGVSAYPLKDNSNADVALTGHGQKAIGIAEGSYIRVMISGGPPTGVKSVIARL